MGGHAARRSIFFPLFLAAVIVTLVIREEPFASAPSRALDTEASVTVVGLPEGGSTDLLVHSFSLPIISSGDDAAGVTTNFDDLTVTVAIDGSTPELLEALSQNRELDEVVLDFENNGAPVMKLRLQSVTVTGVVTGPAKGGSTKVSFAYGRIEFKSGGKSFCWDTPHDSPCQ